MPKFSLEECVQLFFFHCMSINKKKNCPTRVSQQIFRYFPLKKYNWNGRYDYNNNNSNCNYSNVILNNYITFINVKVIKTTIEVSNIFVQKVLIYFLWKQVWLLFRPLKYSLYIYFIWLIPLSRVTFISFIQLEQLRGKVNGQGFILIRYHFYKNKLHRRQRSGRVEIWTYQTT